MKRTRPLLPTVDLSKYDATVGFTAVDWLTHLEARFWAHFNLHANDMTAQELEVARQRAAAFIDQPLASLGYDIPKVSGVRDLWLFQAWGLQNSIRKHGVLVDELESAHLKMASGEYPTIREMNAVCTSMHAEVLSKALDLSGSVGDRSTCITAIDLNVTDEKLKEDFSQWLSAKRAELKVAQLGAPRGGRRITQVDFDRWSEQKVLPYIDLKLWAAARESKISNKAAGEILFPEWDNQEGTPIEDYIRKSVEPLATMLMSGSMQAALSAYGRNQTKPKSG